MLPACEDADRGILTAFFEASGGPSWTRSGGWLSGLPLSDWEGVRVDSDGRVTGLDLPGNGLSGGLPADLSGLAYLEALDLSGNGLSGPLPPELSDLSRLEVLDLSGNPLTGPLPPALSALARLETLDLSFTSLSGPLPLSLARLGALAVLRLEDTGLCALSGEVTSSWLSRIADARVAPCRDPEREILTAFYHATGGPGWKDDAGWLYRRAPGGLARRYDERQRSGDRPGFQPQRPDGLHPFLSWAAWRTWSACSFPGTTGSAAVSLPNWAT